MIKYLALLMIGLLAGGIAAANPKAVQACVDERIAYFHHVHGQDAPIRFDILGEWQKECEMENDVQLSDSVQACVDEHIDYYRNVHGNDAPIRFDILQEWEDKCY